MIKYLLLFLIITGSSFSQDYWERINSPAVNTLSKIFFIDSLKGWAVGDSGMIIFTTDGGLNWDIQNSNVSSDIISLFFLNDSLGWALTQDVLTFPYRTKILNTTDGGSNWLISEYPDENILFNTIYFIDSLTGFLGGSPVSIVRTIDGGLEWREVELSGTYYDLPVLGFEFFNQQFGFAFGGVRDFAGVVWKTVDGGENWYSQAFNPDPIIQIRFLDSLNVYGITYDPELVYTALVQSSDAGENWNFKLLELFGAAYSFSFRTAAEWWSPMGHEGFIFTKDSGESWQTITLKDSIPLYDICFIDSTKGFAVGGNGAIYKYVPNPVSVKDESEKVLSYYLMQNHPNPFNPVTTIEYCIPQDEFVNISVYNLLGEKVATIISNSQRAGGYKISFDASGFASGVYFYSIEAGSFKSVRKMLLMK
jgi:photosystem II stability/assembly factor-like uncharacterized protein